MKPWLEVSKEGLKKQAKEIGPAKIAVELISNALDEAGVSVIDVTAVPVPNRKYVDIVVEDNSPEGFRELSHAFTIFAESYKRSNPEQRGQFNLGEKLFLALCEEAEVSTTKGSIVFSSNGERIESRKRRERGTVVSGRVEMTRSEFENLTTLVSRLLLPQGVSVTFNGETISSREPLHVIETTLPTVAPDEEGVMRPTTRKTEVKIYEVKEGESATIYEMGIPVVATDIRWHVSVGQKIQLNRERDNVRPSYYKKICTTVAEAMRNLLDKDDANTWASVALSDKSASPELVVKIMDEKFGEKRASYDPSDPESNVKGAIDGGTIVSGRMLSKEQWENVKRAGAIEPAGRVWPTPKPYSNDPNADPAEIIPASEWTPGMKNVAEYSQFLAKELMDVRLIVTFVKRMNSGVSACYGRDIGVGRLDFAVHRLGKAWFDKVDNRVDALLIHEFGHQYASVHYSDEYFDALCDLAAKLKDLALRKPEKLRQFMGPMAS
jgi:hypothetical protein